MPSRKPDVAGRLLWKGQDVPANLAKILSLDGARFAAQNQ
jgi:hypothetical protein